MAENGAQPTSWAALTRSRLHMSVALVLGLVVSGVLLWAAMRDVSYDEIATALSDAQWGWLPLSVAVMVLSLVVRAERWRLLLDDPSKVSRSLSFASLNIGVLFNNLLPQRAGEVARIVAINRGAGVSRVETAATIVAERLTDVFVLGAMGLMCWPWLPDTHWVAVIKIVCIVAVAAPLVAVALLSGFRSHLPRIVQRTLHRVPRLGHERSHRLTESLAAGTRVLLRPRRLVEVVALGFVSWGLMALSNWLALQMFDFQIDDPAASMVLVLVAVNFAIAIPAGPGAVGVFEAATQASLVAFGVSSSDALSYAIVTHAIAFFPFIALGGSGMLTVRKSSRERQQDWSVPESPQTLEPTPNS